MLYEITLKNSESLPTIDNKPHPKVAQISAVSETAARLYFLEKYFDAISIGSEPSKRTVHVSLRELACKLVDPPSV